MKKVKDSKKQIRQVMLIILDVFTIFIAGYLALVFRLDDLFIKDFYNDFTSYILLSIIPTIIVFYYFKLYSSLWLFTSYNEIFNILWACMITIPVNILILVLTPYTLPRSFVFLNAILLTGLVAFVRSLYRVIRIRMRTLKAKNLAKSRVMIIGAGEAGNLIISELINSPKIGSIPVIAIDDDKTKKGQYIQGVKVIGGREMIVQAAIDYEIDEIFIALPSAKAKVKSEIITICHKTNCKVKILPGLYQLINEEVAVAKMKDVEISDLLGRDPIKVDLNEIMGYVSNKVVLVTGGGGSIGSELCRQIAKNHPKQLIIFDIYENNAYDIQMELKDQYKDELNLVTLIGSIRDESKLISLFETYHPDIVYHAAAHKHVPLMEDSPHEAVKNNVFGTINLAKTAGIYGVKRFIQISTDKAVDPTNIMGATKRICEMIIQMFNRHYDTEYVAVRFGNVLGSNGSVIPLFKKQIANGGPVTVTHKDIIRYFMTIPEAVSLVLQAGAYANGGEIFILDMGEPVKILTLAENLIRLSGYIPYETMEIVFTGLRPGEKLYEELLMSEEVEDTSNDLIHIGKPIDFDEEQFTEDLRALHKAAYDENEDIEPYILKIIPTFRKKLIYTK